jgi:hypothetical protein
MTGQWVSRVSEGEVQLRQLEPLAKPARRRSIRGDATHAPKYAGNSRDTTRRPESFRHLERAPAEFLCCVEVALLYSHFSKCHKCDARLTWKTHA